MREMKFWRQATGSEDIPSPDDVLEWWLKKSRENKQPLKIVSEKITWKRGLSGGRLQSLSFEAKKLRVSMITIFYQMEAEIITQELHWKCGFF